MAVDERDNASSPKIDAAALFRKLGLKPADAGPILEGWREANAAWRQERRERIALYEQRVHERCNDLVGGRLIAPFSDD